ncbi:MAG: hypothetical protein ACXVQQ_07005 [Gaiellaceae bacterium]
MTGGAAALVNRIPFRIRVGVTGHKDIDSDPRLAGLPQRIRRVVPGSDTTPVLLAAVSALAEGADRLVVEELFADADERGEEARLEAVLPFERKRYVELQQFSAEAEAEFEAWLDRATSVVELAGSDKREKQAAAYEAASRYLVNRSDVLVALWDGEPSRGRGGTADTLLYAAKLGKPCIWVPSEPGAPVSGNFGEGRRTSFLADVRQRARVTSDASPERATRPNILKSLEETYRKLDSFNRAPLPPEPELRRRLDREKLGLDADSDWVAGPFVRAAVLADRYESLFTAATWLMWLLATGAAACLGAGAAFDHESKILPWAEVGCLLALMGVFFAARRLGFHRHWLSYRLLAERLRSAYFIAPTGIDFRRTGGLEAVFVEGRSADWLLRAFEEVWDSRPQAVGPPRAPSPNEIAGLKRRLAVDWVGGQISYHERARRRHHRSGRALTAVIVVLIVGAVVSAIVHAATKSEPAHEISIFLSITLPVTAAALGVVLTVRQHRALAERYGRMHSDLVSVQDTLLGVDAETIGKTASEAARVIAEENGDWFGAMWFLDVEEPP